MNKFTRFVRQRKRVRQAVYQTDRNIMRSIVRTMLVLCLFVLLHVSAMVLFEGMSPWHGFWLTMTTLATVGYGDTSATTVAGQLSTIILMFICGITVMTLLISDYVDYRIARRERIRSGHWESRIFIA